MQDCQSGVTLPNSLPKPFRFLGIFAAQRALGLQFKKDAEGLPVVGTGIALAPRPDIPGHLGMGGQGDFRLPEHLLGIRERLLSRSIVGIRGKQLPPDFQGLKETALIGRLAEFDLEQTYFPTGFS